MFSLSTLMIISALVAITYAWLNSFFTRKFSYWSSMGIGGPRPRWFIGNIAEQTNQVFFHFCQKMRKEYGEVYGTYMGWKPTLVVADPVLAKHVLVKDFHLFIDRINPKAYHELWNKNLFTANGDDWKRCRVVTSPTFSSGKLREMNVIMQKCIKNLDDYFDRIIEQQPEKSSVVFQAKTTFAGFTIDVIASTAFATTTNANMEADSPFVTNGRKLFEIKALRAMAGFLAPTWLLKLVGIETIFPKENFDFFVALSRRMLDQRLEEIKQGKPRRSDLLQMLIDAAVDESELTADNYNKMTVTEEGNNSGIILDQNQNLTKEASTKGEGGSGKLSEKRKLSTSEIIANCILFFAAGYETTSAALSHCIYELAKNQSVQERLSDDLTSALEQFSDNESEEYLAVVNNGIPYLEAVVKETLRRYTPVALLGRVCNAEQGYTFPGTEIHLRKGDVVTLPVVAIHMNEKYYPEPNRFNPERFMPENKANLVPYTYLPFSDGPRNCIAMRFAYQEIKLCLAHLLTRYRFTTTPETPEELTFKPASALLIAEEFPIQVSRR